MEPRRNSWFGTTLVTLGAALLAGVGCTSLTRPTAPAPAPELQLLDAQALALPRDCEPNRGTMYRTSFVVDPGGRVTSISSNSGDGCVERALREWVASFQYQPPERAVPTVIDWMYVSAPRGT